MLDEVKEQLGELNCCEEPEEKWTIHQGDCCYIRHCGVCLEINYMSKAPGHNTTYHPVIKRDREEISVERQERVKRKRSNRRRKRNAVPGTS